MLLKATTLSLIWLHASCRLTIHMDTSCATTSLHTLTHNLTRCKLMSPLPHKGQCTSGRCVAAWRATCSAHPDRLPACGCVQKPAGFPAGNFHSPRGRTGVLRLHIQTWSSCLYEARPGIKIAWKYALHGDHTRSVPYLRNNCSSAYRSCPHSFLD